MDSTSIYRDISNADMLTKMSESAKQTADKIGGMIASLMLATEEKMRDKNDRIAMLESRIAELEAELEQAMAPHDDPENAMHCACVPALKGRIAELEAQLAATAHGHDDDGK